MSEELDRFEMSGSLVGGEYEDKTQYRIEPFQDEFQINLGSNGSSITIDVGEFEHLISRVEKYKQITRLIKENH